MNNDVIGNLEYFSNGISTQLRTIAIGLLSFVWLFLSDGKDVLGGLSCFYRPSFCAIAGLALFALLLDFLQLVFGYVNSLSAMKRGYYERESRYSVVQNSLFWLKILPTAIACIWLILILALGLA